MLVEDRRRKPFLLRDAVICEERPSDDSQSGRASLPWIPFA